MNKDTNKMNIFFKKSRLIFLGIFVIAIGLISLFPVKEVEAAWNYEDISFYVSVNSQSGLSPVYRFYKSGGTNHFYTISHQESEELKGKKGWDYEGVAFYASASPRAGYSPVYRFFNKGGFDHFYTISQYEADYIKSKSGHDWKYEGIAFYASPGAASGLSPLYRFYNNGGTDHFYTMSESEKNELQSRNQSQSQSSSLGPDMKVGILGYDKSYSKSHSFRFKANENYKIKDKNGNTVVDNINKDTQTNVHYSGDGKLHVYGDGFDFETDMQVDIDAADGNSGDMIVDVEPKQFDDYRGRIRVRYSDEEDEVWVINILPLEHYVWGMGEITGTGDMSYNRVMTVVFRTYGYWKIKYSVKHKDRGFIVDTTAGDQIYYGYDWEKDHPRIKRAAEETSGQMVYYDGDVAITPYSSSTDGRTRSWEERWGSTHYPYCKSVPDPWGKVDGAGDIAGNHMVGLSATGALNLAGDEGWSWDKILKYYYTGIDIVTVY